MRARCGRAGAGRWSVVVGKQAAVGFSLFVVRNTNFGLSSKRTFRIVIPSGARDLHLRKANDERPPPIPPLRPPAHAHDSLTAPAVPIPRACRPIPVGSL